MKQLAFFIAMVVLIPMSYALADILVTQGSGTTIFDFVCFATKHCTAHVNVNSAGTEIATLANPFRNDPTGTTTQPVTFQASATGGCTNGVLLTGGTNNATSVKASPGTLCELTVINTTATLVDLRFYDVAVVPNCAASAGIVANYPVQANTTSAGFTIHLGPYGKAFTAGIAFCVTGANANNDNTNAVTGVNVNYSFK